MRIVFISILIVLSGQVFSQNGVNEVIIISTNDVHGNIDNFSKMAAYVKLLKASHPNVFVFNAGDLINGNPVVDMAKEKGYPIFDLMNSIPYDVSCLGNHEFENGEAVLQKRLHQSTSIYLCANMDLGQASVLKPLQRYHILRINDGTSIAIFGLTASSSNPCIVENIHMTDPLEAAKKLQSLRDSADILIALTHIGYKSDSIMAMQLEGLDVVIGGHSHTEIPGGKMVHGTLITQAGDKLRFLGKTTLTIKNHKIINKTFDMVDVSQLRDIDASVQKKINAYNNQPWLHQIAGASATGFNSKESIGALKTDALANELHLDIAFDHVRNISSSSFPKGNITIGDIYDWDSYDYKTLGFQLTAPEIRQLILNSIKGSKEPVLIPSGITYTLIKNKAGVVDSVLLKNKNGPLVEQKRFFVGMNSFIACQFMKNIKAQPTELAMTAAQALVAYLKDHPLVDYNDVTRIIIKEKRYGFKPDIIRGPYLQVATPTSIMVRWRTDEPDITQVRFGEEFGKWDRIAADKNLLREHIITLKGLSPYTKYYYMIEGAKDTLQAEEMNCFTTLPPAGKEGKYRIGVFGDCGNNSVNQRNTRDAFEKYIGNDVLNAWILLGDNAYSFGKDVEYQSNFFNIYKNNLLKRAPLFPAPGNHDYHDEPFSAELAQQSGQVAYYQNFSMPSNGESGGQPSGTPAFYSYDIGNIHFLSLDSHGQEDNNSRLFDTLGRQVTWVKRDLEANRNKGWVIAYWHHPPFTMGSHNSDEEKQLIKIRENFIPILERYGVDLVLCGHSHSYERSRLMKGYYGMEQTFDSTRYDLNNSSGRYDGTVNSCPYIKDSSSNGTVYVVTGSSGALDYAQKAFPHNAMQYSDVSIGGACILEIESNRLDVKWICADGVIRDKFTMMKQVNRKTQINVKKGQTVTLNASFIGNYSWDAQNKTTRSIEVKPGTGTTLYTVHDPFNCLQDSFVVTVTE